MRQPNRGKSSITAAPKRPGRKAALAKPGQRSALGLKVTPEIKNRLDRAAKANGRTQSQEAEARIEQSFRDEDAAQLFRDIYFGRELSALLEAIGRAMRDAGTHAAADAAAAGVGSPEWIDNPYGFDVAAKAAARILDVLRPPGTIEALPNATPRQKLLGEAIANGLLTAIAGKPATDFGEEWAVGVRPRLGRLRERLAGFTYDVGAHSASLPSASAPGIILYDADDKSVLES